MISRLSLAVALLLGRAVIAQTYIVPSGDCGAVTLQISRGTGFPNAGMRIGADEVVKAYVHLPKKRIAVEPVAGQLDVTIPANTLVLASLDLKPAIVGNETRTEHAKAFVQCGAIDQSPDWKLSTDLGLEIFPQWNGPMLKRGESMRFIAIEGGKNLLREIPMELYRAGAGRIATGVHDHAGVIFPFQEPGRYMVLATYRRPDPGQPGLWLVDTSTLTFDIR